MRQKTDFSAVLVNLDGKKLRRGGDPALVQALLAVTEDFDEERLEKLNAKLAEVWGEEQTLGGVCAQALLAHHDEEKKIGGDEQIRRHELARRLYKGGVQQFNDKERELLKNVVRMGFKGNLVYPQVHELLEGAERVVEVQAVA